MIEHHLERFGAHAGFLPGCHRQTEPVAIDEEQEGCKGYEDRQRSTYRLAEMRLTLT